MDSKFWWWVSTVKSWWFLILKVFGTGRCRIEKQWFRLHIEIGIIVFVIEYRKVSVCHREGLICWVSLCNKSWYRMAKDSIAKSNCEWKEEEASNSGFRWWGLISGLEKNTIRIKSLWSWFSLILVLVKIAITLIVESLMLGVEFKFNGVELNQVELIFKWCPALFVSRIDWGRTYHYFTSGP